MQIPILLYLKSELYNYYSNSRINNDSSNNPAYINDDNITSYYAFNNRLEKIHEEDNI